MRTLKTSAQIAYFSMTLTFLVFVWLSHSGILPGSAWGHFWASVALFVLACIGYRMLEEKDGDGYRDKFTRPLLFITGFLYLFNVIMYSVLRAAELIGPRLYESRPEDIRVAVWSLGLFYLLLALAGVAIMHEANKNE